MLTNTRIFSRLKAELKSIAPNFQSYHILEPYLWENMMPEKHYRIGKVLNNEQDRLDKAYFIVSGFIILFFFDERRVRNVFRIYPEGSIVFLSNLIQKNKLKYSIEACRTTVFKSFDVKHIRHLYNELDGTKEMEAALCASNEKHDMVRNRLLSLPPLERVLEFYRVFIALFPAGKFLKYADKASYLNMGLSSFKLYRKVLVGKGLV